MSKLLSNMPMPTLPGEGADSPSEQLVETFNELRGELVSTLWFILKDDAQDAAQEAFLKCWRRRDRFSDIRNARAWIFRIAMNVANDRRAGAWHRRARQLPCEASLIPSLFAPPDECVAQKEDEERLRLAIHGLRPDEKQVFLLRENGDMTYEQIAALRHSPVNTVKTQMRRALFSLRKCLT